MNCSSRRDRCAPGTRAARITGPAATGVDRAGLGTDRSRTGDHSWLLDGLPLKGSGHFQTGGGSTTATGTTHSPAAGTDTQIAQEEPKRPLIESVSLKDFLAQLPHHGYMTIENERGRFLVMVDHKTGETTTMRLSKDDQL